MFTELQGIVMCAETSDVDRELLCLLGTLTSTENCEVYREFLCLQGPVMFTGIGMSAGNCNVSRE